MSVTFGIYIGCSSCCIAVNKDGRFEVVANTSGDRVTPAVVAYHDAEVVTGPAAKQGIIRHAANTIQHVLRVAGTNEDEGLNMSSITCKPSWESGQPRYSVAKGEKSINVSADDVLLNIFVLLKEIASSHTSEPELPLVISIPAWSSEGTIASVKAAAKMASFTVLSVVTQPVAAVLAYGLLDDNKSNMQVVVLHGGGTTVVGSLVEVAGGMLTLRESISSSTVAGDTLTELLVKHFAKEFYTKYKGDPLENRRSKRKLYNAAENSKHVLSTMGTAQVYVESLWEGVDFSTTLSRARFDGLVSATLSDFLIPAKEAVQRSGYTLDQIHKVILTGGSAKIPRLQQLVRDAFPAAEFLCSLPPDEVLSAGASVEAAMLLGRTSQSPVLSSMVPALAVTVNCMILNTDSNECVFSRGTPTHSRHSINLPLPSSTSSECSVIIYEGERCSQNPEEECILVKVDLTSLMPESKLLKLDFHLKSDGSLHVNLSEPVAKINRMFIIEGGRS
ncbi:heat shock 70 kDa protein 14-like [Macrobrachium nipponense]|uniref:heat shock 70 kDa protein 14-like n=1 Tax=Macrobrachium nipponense TaxID=159736 RepID=UPI0030C8D0DF